MIKKAQPLVTIAIPTYNRADGYLRESLASAMNQTYQNIKIIVSDIGFCLITASGGVLNPIYAINSITWSCSPKSDIIRKV